MGESVQRDLRPGGKFRLNLAEGNEMTSSSEPHKESHDLN